MREKKYKNFLRQKCQKFVQMKLGQKFRASSVAGGRRCKNSCTLRKHRMLSHTCDADDDDCEGGGSDDDDGDDEQGNRN